MELDINHIEEVIVKYLDGREIVFRGRGLEKFRTLVKKSPPLVKPAPSKSIIVEKESSEEVSESSEEEVPRAKKKTPKTVNGYNTVHLDYGGGSSTPQASGGRGLSPHDIAKNMQRQAEIASGIKY